MTVDYLQHATLTGRVTLVCSTICLPLNHWPFHQLSALQVGAQYKETVSATDPWIDSVLSPTTAHS
jgi:hypothetical protein